MGFWIVGAIVLIIVGVLLRRGLQMKALAQGGVAARAEVIQKSRRHSRTGQQTAGYIKYRFLTPDGKQLTNRITVSEQIYSEYQEGEHIDIVYLEDRPAVNAARYMVNLTRKALKLPPR